MFLVIRNKWTPVGPFIQFRERFSNLLDAARRVVDLDEGPGTYVLTPGARAVDLEEARDLVSR